MKSTDKFVLVLVASLALLLAGCGGGSSTPAEPEGPTPEEIAEMEAMQMRAMEQKADLEEANEALDTALAATLNTQDALDAANAAHMALAAAIEAAADVSAADKAMYESAASAAMVRIADAQKIFEAAEAERMAMEEEQRKMEEAAKASEMAKVGKALKAAIAAGRPADLTVTPTSIPMFDLDGAGTGSDTSDALTLKKGASVGSLGSWAGTDYAGEAGRGDAKTTGMVRVYSNQGAAKSVTFASEAGAAVHGWSPANGVPVGDYTVDTATATQQGAVGGFPTAGTTTYVQDKTVTGTFMGASGTYECTAATCTAAVTTDGVNLGTGWTFTPVVGATLQQPDPDYLRFGWWVRKDKDGPTHAGAFYSTVGTAPATLSNVNAIVGSATYNGKAAGKFALSNPLDSTGDGGHFTADATLTAKFSGTGAGITGMIDNFMANDQSVPWSVALNNRHLASDTVGAAPGNNIGTDGAITSAPDYTTATPNVDDSKTTVWSIDGNSAPASGTWSGLMYDEKPGNAPTGDGSDIPTTVLGTFQSEFGSIGSMVGAFGAEKE